MTGKYDMKLKSVLQILSVLLVALVIVFIFNLASIYRYSTLDGTQKADCAIVAGAGVSQNYPSPIFQERLNHALWLWLQGYISHIILTGGHSPNASYSDAEIARRYLLEKGVPAEIILLEETSTVTRENLLNAKAIMEKKHFRSALLVSDPLHMRRIMLMAQDYGIQGWTSPTQTSRIQSWSVKTRFLIRETFYFTGYSLQRLL